MKELSGKIFKQESQRSATNTPPETERKMKKDKQNKYEFNIPSAILAAGVIGFAAYKWFTK